MTCQPPPGCLIVEIKPFIGCAWGDNYRQHPVTAFLDVLAVANRLDPSRVQRIAFEPGYGSEHAHFRHKDLNSRILASLRGKT